MKAAGLFIVFVVVKVAALADHRIALSWWAPVAYLWQDAIVVLAYAALDTALARHRRMSWSLYGTLAAYTIVNIPVMRALSTPLTAPMLRAARGPLTDSIWLYATWQNATVCAVAIIAACTAPPACRRVRPAALAAALVVLAVLGPVAVPRLDTHGLERNAWTALAASLTPRMAARAAGAEGAEGADWRSRGFNRTRVEDLPAGLPAIAAGRNVVLVSLESTAAAYLGLYGAEPDAMPNFSALARSAVVFDSAYAVYPESIKGLYSILCSAYPALDRAIDAYAATSCDALPEVLRAAGYSTALFHSGRFIYLGMEAVVRNRGFQTLEDAGDIGVRRTSSFGVDESATVERMLAWLDRLPRGRPFFLTYLPIAGHHPYETGGGGPFAEGDDFGRYRNALHSGDAALGTLMRGLDARGLQQNTLWIVLGDHGEAFGQHDGNFGHTFQLYDENVRVPLVIAAPGLFAHSYRSRRVVSLIDTAPTVLDLLGLDRRPRYQGRSLLDPEPRVALFFADYSLAVLGIRDGSTKFTYELDSGRARMFDVESDPNERLDVAARHVERARSYENLLREWAAAQVYVMAQP